MRKAKPSQSGIVIGPILFIVAILAVLATAIAAGSGSFNSDTSAVKAKAQASAILEYANEVKMAVDRVRGHGCADEQVSFENPLYGNYVNPNAPGNKSCHVFDPNGGGISYKTSLVSALDDTLSSDYGFGYWVFSGRSCIMGVGTCISAGSSRGQLLMGQNYIRKDVCLEINKALGNAVPENDAAYTDSGCAVSPYHFFTGSYAEPEAATIHSSAGYKKVIGCYKGGTCGYPIGGGGYHFYQALIIR